VNIQLSDIARAAGGHLEGNDLAISNWSIDSRSIAAGALFFCIRGDRFDGHDYAALAVESGASAIVTEFALDASVPQLIVPDTRKAFGYFASLWRHQMSAKIVAVTGSNGKTTLKQMLSAIFAQVCNDVSRVQATHANNNNDIGVPSTLLGLQPQHRYAVVEIGANLRGEIEWCSGLVKPDVALITNVSASHLQGFGSVGDVAREKGAIYQSLGSAGIGVVNADDEYAEYWRGLLSDRRVLSFGTTSSADIRVEYNSPNRVSLWYSTEQRSFALQLAGKHNALNAAAAAAVAIACGASLEQVVSGLQKVEPVAGRLNIIPRMGGGPLIDDTYNANPASMRAAIDVALQVQGSNPTVLIMGDLLELGDQAADLHHEIGVYARTAGVAELYGYGELSKNAVRAFGENAHHYSDLQSLLDVVVRKDVRCKTLLVKGSRSMKMEAVVEVLRDPDHVAAEQGVVAL